MKITAREALDLGIWGYVADANGIEPWAIKEGMDENTEFNITVEQIKQWL